MTTPDPHPHLTPLRWTGTAIALLIIGLLILVPSGLCTAGFGIIALMDFFSNPENSDAGTFVSEALMFGGPFIVIGALFVFGALRARKPK